MKNNQDNMSFKPFRLVKFFSFSALVVLLLAFLALTWFLSNHAKSVMWDRNEAYALVLAENLNHQVFQQFVLPTVLRYGEIALRNPQQFERLDLIVRNIIHGMNIQSVTIFDSKENVTSYSTEHERIGHRGEGGPEYQKALVGENNSVLVSQGSLVAFLLRSATISCQLKTYIPFHQKKPLGESTDVVMGVIEITQDLSNELETVIRLQGVILLASVAIMTVLFVVLRLIVARADRIIELRNQERWKLEERLHHSERLASLGKMVASVSHEIKNPLGIVGSTAEILRKRLVTLAPGNEHLARIIVEETGRLDRVVREFLDFARPQKPNKTLVEVNKLLAAVLEFCRADLEEHGVLLEVNLGDSVQPILADGDLLYRAFLNIIINARQAMTDGGKLMVKSSPLEKKGVGVVIEISDNGPGMSVEEREQVFQPFFTTKNRGSGLGLAIVKNVIDSHDGLITVKSEPGEGSMFRIALPAGEDQ